jgi:hypothetical protein
MIYMDRLPMFLAELAATHQSDTELVATVTYLLGAFEGVSKWNAAAWPPNDLIALDHTRNGIFWEQSQTYPDPNVQALLSWALTVLNQVGDQNAAIRQGRRPPGGPAQGFWG